MCDANKLDFYRKKSSCSIKKTIINANVDSQYINDNIAQPHKKSIFSYYRNEIHHFLWILAR